MREDGTRAEEVLVVVVVELDTGETVEDEKLVVVLNDDVVDVVETELVVDVGEVEEVRELEEELVDVVVVFRVSAKYPAEARITMTTTTITTMAALPIADLNFLISAITWVTG